MKSLELESNGLEVLDPLTPEKGSMEKMFLQ